jgi:cytoskeletal protein CcmA (bactofilin family)
MIKSEFEGKEVKAFLGEGTKFKGVLKFDGTVRLDGFLEGEIITNGTLIIGEKAHILAELSAGTIITLGKIEGNISASKKIEIRAKSQLIGNIKTPVLFIEEGASFEGQCEMLGKENKKVISIASKEPPEPEEDNFPEETVTA